jgi:hypothetical protein
MDKKGILTKIKELFTSESFEQDYKTQDGRIIRVMGGLDVGTEVKELDSEGESDIEDGNYILEDGVVLMIHGGKITEITEITNDEEGEDEEAMGDYKEKDEMGDKKPEEEKDDMESPYNKEIDTKLVDGTEIRILTKGEAISVGDMVLVKVGEGYKEAPEGRHEVEGGLVVYTDAEGNINEIETKETEEKDEEGMAEVFAAITSLVDEVKKLRSDIKKVKEENIELKNKFNKFAKEPSATPTKHEVKFNKNDKDAKLKFFAR